MINLKYSLATLSILIGLFILGCEQNNKSTNTSDLQQLSVTKELSISLKNDKVLIGSFSGLAVADNGDIYAADGKLQTIHVFSKEGIYKRSIGRKGKGPGEFIDLDSQITILSDILYVLQSKPRRIELFNIESGQFIRTISIPDIKIDGASIGSPREIFPLKNGNVLVFCVNPNYLKPDDEAKPKMMTLAELGPKGEFIKKALIRIPTPYPTNQKLVFVGEGIYVYAGLDFLPKIVIEKDSDNVIYIGKTESLIIHKYTENGAMIGSISAPTQPAVLSEAYLDSLFHETSKYFKKALNEAGQPEFWPVFSDLLIDSKGWLWVEIINPAKSKLSWWGFSNGKAQWMVQLPKDVEIDEMKKGKIYGIKSAEGDFTKIVRYKMEEI